MANPQSKTFQSIKELFEYALETKMDFDDYMAQMNQLMGKVAKPLGVEYDANWSD
jgi:hypothetical protein